MANNWHRAADHYTVDRVGVHSCIYPHQRCQQHSHKHNIAGDSIVQRSDNQRKNERRNKTMPRPRRQFGSARHPARRKNQGTPQTHRKRAYILFRHVAHRRQKTLQHVF